MGDCNPLFIQSQTKMNDSKCKICGKKLLAKGWRNTCEKLECHRKYLNKYVNKTNRYRKVLES